MSAWRDFLDGDQAPSVADVDRAIAAGNHELVALYARNAVRILADIAARVIELEESATRHARAVRAVTHGE